MLFELFILWNILHGFPPVHVIRFDQTTDITSKTFKRIIIIMIIRKLFYLSFFRDIGSLIGKHCEHTDPTHRCSFYELIER